MIIVSKDGTGDFIKVQDAVDSIPKNNTTPVTIFIKSGTYKEKLLIDRSYVTLEGEEVTSTILSYQDYALMLMEDGCKRGTFRTPSTMIDASHITVKHITFENAAGSGRKVGQALAAYVDGDCMYFEDCHFLGSQDTLFTAPLPPASIQIGGFTGPKEDAPRIHGRHYYKDCFICGDVDFIFGSATAYFEHCEIHSISNPNPSGIMGYVTAASTPEEKEYGYVFYQCKFTSNCPPQTVYLGRPWRNYAKTVLLECELNEHIKEEGWHDWKKEEAHETVFYAEYASQGAGACPEKRCDWTHQLSEEESKRYSKQNVLGDWKIE